MNGGMIWGVTFRRTSSVNQTSPNPFFYADSRPAGYAGRGPAGLVPAGELYFHTMGDVGHCLSLGP